MRTLVIAIGVFLALGAPARAADQDPSKTEPHYFNANRAQQDFEVVTNCMADTLTLREPTLFAKDLVLQGYYGVYGTTTEVLKSAADGVHTLQEICDGKAIGTATVTVVHANPDPLSAPVGATFNPNTVNRDDQHPHQLEVSNVPCDDDEVVLFDAAKTGQPAFDYTPVIYDDGFALSEPLGDGTYGAGVRPNPSGTVGPHIIAVQCRGVFVKRTGLGVTGKGGSATPTPTPTPPPSASPTNHAPSSTAKPLDLRIAWTYDSKNPYKEKSDSPDLSLRWPACAARHGTLVQFPTGERIYDSLSDTPPHLKHVAGTIKYRGGVYVGATLADGGVLHIHKIRCIKAGKVVTYGKLDVRLHHHYLTYGPLEQTVTGGQHTQVALELPRCRDPKAGTVTLKNDALEVDPLLRTDGSFEFMGDVYANAGGDPQTLQATLGCGSGKIGTQEITYAPGG